MGRKRTGIRRMLGGLTALALTLPLTGAGAWEEMTDVPPAVLWLGDGWDTATYLGEGVVEVGRIHILEEKGGLKFTSRSYLDLNGEELEFPLERWVELSTGEEAWLYGGEGFWNGYMAVHGTTTGSGNETIYHWGLIDSRGNFVVPIEYSAEEEVWARMGLFLPEFPSDHFSPEINNDCLYGYREEDGTLLVDYQFDVAMPFTGRMYTQVTKDGRVGLLKDPRRKETISSWAEEEVAAALDAGMVPSRCKGYYTYEITRSQMAALLVGFVERVLGEALSLPEEHPFTDTQDGYIEKAHAAGIVQGVGEGLFSPDKVVTREQLATMLCRAMALVEPGWGENVPLPTGYTDLDQVSDWAREGLSALLARGMMQGVSETRISPKTFCTTEQAILLVWRWIQG